MIKIKLRRQLAVFLAIALIGAIGLNFIPAGGVSISPSTGHLSISTDIVLASTPAVDTDETKTSAVSKLPPTENIAQSPSPDEVNLSVNASTDDAWEDESTGLMNLDSGGISILAYDVDYGEWGGFRWDGLNISQGSTINNCTLEVYGSASFSDIYANLHFELGGSPTTFTNATNDIQDRTLTDASVLWDAVLSEAWYNSSELKTVLQEVVDSYTITSIVSIWKPNHDSPWDDCTIFAWDGNSSYAAKLHINYTAPPVINITNTPASYDFGDVGTSSTPATGLTAFNVTNNGDCAVNISIKGTNMTDNDQSFFPIDSVECTPAVADTWVEVDLDNYTAGLGSDVTGVILHYVNTATTNFPAFGLRKSGSTDNRTGRIEDQTHSWAAIGVDSNHVFEAYVNHTTEVDIYIVGYTKTGVTFFTNAYEKTLSTATDWKTPENCTSVDRDSKVAWSEAAQAKTSDNLRAYQTLSNDYGDWLRCTDFNFTTSDIPEGAVIDGIEVKIERKVLTENNGADDALYLRNATGQVGDDKATATLWTTTDVEETHGASNDSWSAGLSDSDIRASTFGVDFSAFGTTMVFVDCVSIRVHYAPSNVWTDIDCSTEAPDAIGLIFEVQGDIGGWINPPYSYFGLRKNGSTDSRTEKAQEHCSFGWIIGCDTNQICEGLIDENLDGDRFTFYLVGYVTAGAVFNTNATDLSLDTTLSWLDLDTLPSNSVIGFIEMVGAHWFGLRKDGSAEDIYKFGAHAFALVECSANYTIEGKIANTSVDFWLIGYATSFPPWILNDTATPGADVYGLKAGLNSTTEAAEFKKPTNFTDTNENWNNETQGYDVSTPNDQTTAADSGVAPNDLDPWITFHTWGAKEQTYTATKLNVNWKTDGSWSNDEIGLSYTKDGGGNWTVLVALAVHNETAMQTSSADLDADQDLTQVQVKTLINRVSGGDTGHLYIYDVWTNGTYTVSGDYNVTVKLNSPYNDLCANLSVSATQGWGLKLYTPTSFSDGYEKTGTVTLTATEA